MAETPEAISASDQSIIFFAVAKAVCAKFLIRDSCIKSGSEKNTKCMRVKLDLPRVQTKTENFFRHIFAGRTEKIQHSLTQEEKDKNGFFFSLSISEHRTFRPRAWKLLLSTLSHLILSRVYTSRSDCAVPLWFSETGSEVETRADAIVIRKYFQKLYSTDIRSNTELQMHSSIFFVTYCTRYICLIFPYNR